MDNIMILSKSVYIQFGNILFTSTAVFLIILNSDRLNTIKMKIQVCYYIHECPKHSTMGPLRLRLS